MSRGEGRLLFSPDPARVCTIAGSDSGGGAGIQADLKTIQAVGGYGLSVTTALTAQNTRGVQAISTVPAEFVGQQLRSVSEDIEIDAYKIGMLATRDTVQVVARALRSRPQHGAPVVLDPVMVSSSGSLLLKPDAIDVLLSDLLPQCALITPNLPESSAILHYYGQTVPHGLPALSLPGFTTAPPDEGKPASELRCVAMLEAARLLAVHSGAETVLLKGGHGSFTQTEVEGLLSQLGVTPVTPPVRIVGTSDSLDAKSLLADVGDLDARVYLRPDTGQSEVSVVRTDMRPWTTVLIPQRTHPATGLTVEPPLEGGEVVADVLCESLRSKSQESAARYRYTIFIKPLVPTTATHGTGCTLSSAIATYLASGRTVRSSVLYGIEYVQGALLHGLDRIGGGQHPLNHAHALVSRALAHRSQGPLRLGMQPLTSQLIGSALGEWNEFVHHPFVEQLGQGTLPLPAFQHFLLQDYLFLRHYANIWALGAGKADELGAIRVLVSRCVEMVQEAQLHVKFCARWAISRPELEQGSESRATLAYTRYVLDMGRRCGRLERLVATLPCMLGYAEVGKSLALAHPAAREEGNPYVEWIEAYAQAPFQQAAVEAVNLLEEVAQRETVTPTRLRSLQHIFHTTVKLEQGMWDEAMAVARGETVL